MDTLYQGKSHLGLELRGGYVISYRLYTSLRPGSTEYSGLMMILSSSRPICPPSSCLVCGTDSRSKLSGKVSHSSYISWLFLPLEMEPWLFFAAALATVAAALLPLELVLLLVMVVLLLASVAAAVEAVMGS